MLTDARQNIAQSVQRLVEHAGRVQGQIDSELGSFRTVGQAYQRLAKESNELSDRCVTGEQTIDAHTAELAEQNKNIIELNARIAELQRILEQEQQSRSQIQFELQQTVATNKQETKQLKQARLVATEELNANHAAELDKLTRQHAAETLKSNNAFQMLEQRLDAVAQSHMKQIAAGKEEILKLKAELGILSPQHAQQATDLQSKDSENKKLLSALQKAHALGETAKRELKSEADELVTVKETLRRALAATEKAQNQYTAEQEETQKLRDQLAGVKGDLDTSTAAHGEEQEEVTRLREAFRVTQQELEVKMEATIARTKAAQQVEMDAERDAAIAQCRQQQHQAYEAVLRSNEAHTQELLGQIDELAGALQQARQPKKRLSMSVGSNGKAVFSQNVAADHIQYQNGFNQQQDEHAYAQ